MTIRDDERWKIAVFSLTSLGEDYNTKAIFDFAWRAFLGGGMDNQRKVNIYPKESRFCSQLFADAYGKSTGKLLSKLSTDIITPAGLSMTKDLRDVQIHWAEIGPSEN